MSDAHCRSRDPAPHINHWVYEAMLGQIKGYDGEGRELLAIEADPDFAKRLVAAFSAVFAPARLPVEAAGPVPTQY